jgi:hypothetical protein
MHITPKKGERPNDVYGCYVETKFNVVTISSYKFYNERDIIRTFMLTFPKKKTKHVTEAE